MTNGSRIADGRTAEIFAWGDDQILKLYRRGSPPRAAKREASRSRTVASEGVAVPAVIDEIEVDGRAGILFERLSGPTMLQAMLTSPDELPTYADSLAELHAELHSHSIADLPGLKARLGRRIRRAALLSRKMRSAALDQLASLPDGNAICHGDFHPQNVMMTASGPVIVDWADVTRGHPIADVARSSLLIAHATPLDDSIGPELDPRRQRFLEAYLARYRQIRPFELAELSAWELPVVAARLDEENIAGEADALLTMLRALV